MDCEFRVQNQRGLSRGLDLAASPAWTFLGKGGLPGTGFPENHSTAAIGSHLGYVRRIGEHGLAAADWVWLVDFADSAFKERNGDRPRQVTEK